MLGIFTRSGGSDGSTPIYFHFLYIRSPIAILSGPDCPVHQVVSLGGQLTVSFHSALALPKTHTCTEYWQYNDKGAE